MHLAYASIPSDYSAFKFCILSLCAFARNQTRDPGLANAMLDQLNYRNSEV